MSVYRRIYLAFLLCVCQQCRSDNFINSFVDKYLDNLWAEADSKDECVQHFTGKVFNDGKLLKVVTSNAATEFLCWGRRNGDITVEQESENKIVFQTPLEVSKIIFDFENVKIMYEKETSNQRDLGKVDFVTEGKLSIKTEFIFSEGSNECKTDVDVDVKKLDDFKCFVKGIRNDVFEIWVNSNVKPKFSVYMEKQYKKFLDKLDICNSLVRYMRPKKDKANSISETEEIFDNDLSVDD